MVLVLGEGPTTTYGKEKVKKLGHLHYLLDNHFPLSTEAGLVVCQLSVISPFSLIYSLNKGNAILAYVFSTKFQYSFYILISFRTETLLIATHYSKNFTATLF